MHAARRAQPDNHTNAANYLAEAGAPTNNPWISLGAVTCTNRTFRNKDKGIVGITAANKIASVTLSGPSPAEGVAGPLFSSRAWPPRPPPTRSGAS